MKYPKKRELTGVYVFVERDGERTPQDFTDLTEAEMFEFLRSHGKSKEWMAGLIDRIAQEIVNVAHYLADDGIGNDELIDLCAFMGTSLHLIGDSYGLCKVDVDEQGEES